MNTKLTIVKHLYTIKIGDLIYVIRLDSPQGFVIPPTIDCWVPMKGKFTFTYSGSDQYDVGKAYGISQQTAGRYIKNAKERGFVL